MSALLMIIDGVDECVDKNKQTEFLNILKRAGKRSACHSASLFAVGENAISVTYFGNNRRWLFHSQTSGYELSTPICPGSPDARSANLKFQSTLNNHSVRDTKYGSR
ncbi:hypothetical protein M378DRAFT_408502 [Amanita muscaria Koide BX008]|uniref:Uncharacterized protein n=1 Tax=Amanita muscaria (strain Koide BX008) TaxID=946122 RepID=A0A0C2XA85_AMAMK|nr:hypothetical protein M378DRAFT_408502 [Amanita muscaria Koide BX008]